MLTRILSRGAAKALALTVAAIALPAQSANLTCVAKVGSVTVHPWGGLYVEFIGMGHPVLCNVNYNYATGDPNIGTINLEVCKAWLGTLLTAKSTGQSITLLFSFPGAAPACNAIPNFSWTTPNPYPSFMSLAN